MANKYKLIDPSSISYENIKKDLLEYIKNLPDNAKWKDFYESGAGTTHVELLAGLGTYLSFHSMGARRESYLDTAKLYSSAVNICNIIGHPVNRVSAPILRINFTLTSSVLWDRTVPCFSYKNRNVSLYTSQTLLAGTQEMDFVIGDWKTTEFTSKNNDKFANTLILEEGIDANLFDNTLELFINGAGKAIVKHADNFLPNNVLLKTYPGGVLLVFGDGIVGYQLRVNDNVVFNYIVTSGPIDANAILPEELTKYLNCKINSVQIINPGYNADSIPKLSAVAPGYLTTKRRMVTGEDHKYIFMNYSGSMVSAGWKKQENECCTIFLSYLFDNEHIALTPELDLMYAFLDDYKMVGERIIIVPPVKFGLEMKVVVIIEEGIQQNEIETTLRATIDQYTMKLGTTFHIGQIVSDLSKVDGVKRVYLVRPVSDKTLQYNEYLKLAGLQIILTANSNYVVHVDPDNNGFWRFLNKSTNTGTEVKKLINSSAHFDIGTLQVGSLIVNTTLDISAHVVSIDSPTQLTLDTDIFTATGQTYESYDVNV